MANYGPASAFLLVGGIDISGDVYGFVDTVEQSLQEVRALGESWDRFLPVGVGKVTLETTGGLYDDRASGQIAALQGKAATVAESPQLVEYGVAGTGLGQPVSMVNGTYVGQWVRTAARDGLTMANGVHTLTGAASEGRIVGALTSRSGDGNTQSTPLDQADYATAANITSSSAATERVTTAAAHGLATGDWVLIAGHTGSTPDINGNHQVTVFDADEFSMDDVADITVGGTGGTFKKVSSAGLIADLQLTALVLGAASDVVVKVRHSSDNSSYSDLITFAAKTAVGAERVETTTDAKRYLAISWTGTGAAITSATPFVAVVRT